MTDLYAVMGNPINHSKSPDIHTQFAKQAGMELLYTAMLVPKDKFNGAVTDFFNGSGKGLNITVPFKENAYNFADSLTDRARTAQAVNTLKLQEDGSILGELAWFAI
jgi:shikimate dehydrogenase